MEEFITEHGSVIVSGIISILMISIMFIVIWAISNIDFDALTMIVGE